MRYEHIFFDLDRTLWDFETNAYQTLTELVDTHQLTLKGVDSSDSFIDHYLQINERMWDEYRKGLIDQHTLRYQRFHQTLLKYEINDTHLTEQLSNDYVRISPLKTTLLPHAIEVLDYLNDKYNLHIITNGFEEVQHVKIEKSGIKKYFSEIITSQRAGYKKPDVKIFEYSTHVTNASIDTSLMIGDSIEADIIGARNAGLDQVYFNPNENTHTEDITYEIKNLKELMQFL